ncbi:hypothetical protein EJ08DRAFT_462485 [Tothia fuscella]|uniref:LsmAD domain-containing protein n=1 Tax=Tothia fuscella TaxID=1048955 RepID=A0A9P4NJ15_9PEZI|nr:hypothetical protein EJ08DRAFT_462485 [Tothia fuscella]
MSSFSDFSSEEEMGPEYEILEATEYGKVNKPFQGFAKTRPMGDIRYRAGYEEADPGSILENPKFDAIKFEDHKTDTEDWDIVIARQMEMAELLPQKQESQHLQSVTSHGGDQARNDGIQREAVEPSLSAPEIKSSDHFGRNMAWTHPNSPNPSYQPLSQQHRLGFVPYLRSSSTLSNVAADGQPDKDSSPSSLSLHNDTPPRSSSKSPLTIHENSTTSTGGFNCNFTRCTAGPFKLYICLTHIEMRIPKILRTIAPYQADPISSSPAPETASNRAEQVRSPTSPSN